MDNVLAKLESLSVKPKNKDLYFRAFTHSTFSNENKNSPSYEVLEFLGDSILSMLVTEYIYKHYFSNEGHMSLLKTNTIKGSTLTEFSLTEGFDRLIRTGNTKEKMNQNHKVLEDVFEAFIAALYLDLGIQEVKIFLARNVFKHISESSVKELKNPKTILQEFLRGESRGTIVYKTEKHGNDFVATIFWNNQKLGTGNGSTKKAAEVDAANDALKKVGKNETN